MSQQLIALNNALSLGSLDTYIHRVNQIAVLSAEEEGQLAQRFLQHNDVEAARALVLAHLRFVVRVARGYVGYGLPLGDIIQEGNVGLMKAVRRFDPKVGVRLVSFAVHWIKAEIHEFVVKNWRIVKVATTKAQRKCFFNLRSMKQRLGWFSREEVAAVAEELGVSVSEVQRMEQRLNAMDCPYDAPDSLDDEHNYLQSPADYLADEGVDPAHLLESFDQKQHEYGHLSSALEQLDDRSRDILYQRWLGEQKATLHDLADKYQVSAERIRQLEKNAMLKVRRAIESAA